MADVSLVALHDTHFEVDRVADDVYLCRLQVIEQITIVPILITHGILIFRESFVHEFLVIDITFLHAEQTAQIVG